MKLLILTVLSATPSLLFAQAMPQPEKQGFIGAQMVEHIIDSARYTTAHGPTLKLLFIKNEDGSLAYDFERQLPDVQEAHLNYCVAKKMYPSMGESVLAGTAIGGFDCISKSNKNNDTGSITPLAALDRIDSVETPTGIGLTNIDLSLTSRASGYKDNTFNLSNGSLTTAIIVGSCSKTSSVEVNQNFLIETEIICNNPSAGIYPSITQAFLAEPNGTITSVKYVSDTYRFSDP